MLNLNGNWVDLVIILALLYYALQSFRYGFWGLFSDFMSFLGSLIISLKTYGLASGLLKNSFSLPGSVANALGFIFTAIVLEIVLSQLFTYLVAKLPKRIRKNKYNKFLGLAPAMGEGILLIGFLVTALMALPVNPQVKSTISDSIIASEILKGTAGVERAFKDVFGEAIEDALTHTIVKPGSRETVKLDSKVGVLTVDEQAEAGMLALVNKERRNHGVHELTWNPEIVPVSRAYAKDMWERKYFSHYSPEGDDVGDRLNKAGIKYFVAGENLALAPTLQSAHTGLMNSEGHRENILNPEFKKVGIGVIDNGYYGKIFVQVFTN